MNVKWLIYQDSYGSKTDPKPNHNHSVPDIYSEYKYKYKIQ